MVWMDACNFASAHVLAICRRLCLLHCPATDGPINMGDHDNPPTCLSAVEHKAETVRDWTAHYFGCIEISKRPEFLSRKNNERFWNEYLEVQRGILKQDVETTSLRKLDIDANNKVDKKILSLANDIEAMYKRTDTVRRALAKEPCSHHKGEEGQHGTAGQRSTLTNCNLIFCINDSRKSWKNSERFVKGMRLIRKWKKKAETSIDDTTEETDDNETGTGNAKVYMDAGRQAVRDIITGFGKENAETFAKYSKEITDSDYILKRDIKGYVIQWDIVAQEKARKHDDDYDSEDGEAIEDSQPARSTNGADAWNNKNDRLIDEPEYLDGPPAMNANNRVDRVGSKRKPATLLRTHGKGHSSAENFLRSEDDMHLKGTFPDQRISLECLLGEASLPGEKHGILSHTRSKDKVRYVHIPYNNMEVRSNHPQ